MTCRANRSGFGEPHLLALLAVICLICHSCGDAYSTQVPTRMITTTMHISRDFARVGETVEIEAVIFAPEPTNFVTGYDFGSGINVFTLISGTSVDCDVDTSGLTVPDHFEQTTLFPVCISAKAQDNATLGERTISIEIQSNESPVVARTEFYLLPAFQ